MSKKEILSEIKSNYDLKCMYEHTKGTCFSTIFIGSALIPAMVYYGVSGENEACIIASIIAGVALSVGIGIRVNASKKIDNANVKLDALFNYVDDGEEKEIGNQKELLK